MSVDTTNYGKFQTRNPVVQRLIGRFYSEVENIVSRLSISTVLDAGCGEGETLERLRTWLPEGSVGIDLNQESVDFAANRLPWAHISTGNVYELSFSDSSFDLVLCLEVLEHLDEPKKALAELARVASGDIVLSVPYEPWFRLGSFARGKYLKTLGNHPEHVNHWNPESFRRFLSDQVNVISVRSAAPWVIAHCESR